MNKYSFILAFLFCATISYAQQNKELTLNEESNLIEATYYHDNGVISQKGTFNLARKLHGEWISYDENGKKLAVGSYLNGVKTGKWTFWSDDSVKEVVYDNNTIASVDGAKTSAGLVKNN